MMITLHQVRPDERSGYGRWDPDLRVVGNGSSYHCSDSSQHNYPPNHLTSNRRQVYQPQVPLPNQSSPKPRCGWSERLHTPKLHTATAAAKPCIVLLIKRSGHGWTAKGRDAVPPHNSFSFSWDRVLLIFLVRILYAIS
jgi:hypothetical protein